LYRVHFGLNERPFGITPDTSYAFATASHQEALNTLVVALSSGEGFIKITGPVGAGKTLLCRRFLATLGDKYFTAYLHNPSLAPTALLLAVADELGLKLDPAQQQTQLLKHINKRLLDLARGGKKVVFCVDEAQSVPLESLEALRLLSNLETEKRKLLHLVLFGQPELNRKLADPSVRQLLQRIAFHYELKGLRQDELASYVEHRLKVAGYSGGRLFSNPALARLHRYSRGLPRLVNILANKALLAAYGEGEATVATRHVKAAARDTEAVGAGRWWFPFFG